MLDDVIEFTVRFIFEILCFYTGEVVLYLLTGGRKKPRWDYYTTDTTFRFIVFTDISTYIGIAFWIGAVVLVVNVLH